MLDNLLKIISFIVFIFIDLYVYLRIFYREKLFNRPLINQTPFKKLSINLANAIHSVYELGDLNASSDKTIVMIGGIPTNPIESMTWLAKCLNDIDSSLRIIIFNMPFYESHNPIIRENKYAETNGSSIINGKIFDFSNYKIDSRLSHKNQSKTINLLMNHLNINSAHLVGHDRGAVILENLCINNPEKVISYSRGSQVWDFVDPEWESLAPDILVGPPHKIMSSYHQLRILMFSVLFINKPIHLLSESFKLKAKIAKKGTHLYDQYTHLKYKTQISYKRFAEKFKQSLCQGGMHKEVENRANLKNINIPIMQFQGEDEFARDKKGTLISDQPYFGNYNLFKNEIEDIYPNATDQTSVPIRKEFIIDKGEYKEIKLKSDATFKRFCIIPDSAHFNVIENPTGCANAIYDFIKTSA